MSVQCVRWSHEHVGTDRPDEWPTDAPPPVEHDPADYLRLLAAERALSEGRPLPVLLAAVQAEADALACVEAGR